MKRQGDDLFYEKTVKGYICKIPQSKLFCSPNHCLRFPICLYENNSTHELSYEPTEHKFGFRK
jgi:hypothetical protein